MIFVGAIAALLCNGWVQNLDAQRESVRFIDSRFLGPFSNVYNVQRGYTQEDVLRWRLQNVLASSERVAEFHDLST
jgi:hypothetical protein